MRFVVATNALAGAMKERRRAVDLVLTDIKSEDQG